MSSIKATSVHTIFSLRQNIKIEFYEYVRISIRIIISLNKKMHNILKIYVIENKMMLEYSNNNNNNNAILFFSEFLKIIMDTIELLKSSKILVLLLMKK